MKVTLRPADGNSFEVEIDAACTVYQLKTCIGDFPQVSKPPGCQRLYYEEQLLDDEKTLADYGIDEQKCIVLKIVENVDTDDAAVADFDSEPGDNPSLSDPLEIVLAHIFNVIKHPGAYNVDEDLLDDITEMGFPRPEVRYALSASYNDPDLAVEFLSDGMPQFDILADIQVQAAQPSVGDEPNVLGFLRDNRNFLRLRRILNARPEFMPAVLLSLEDLNPQLLTAIQDHPKEFIELLRDDEQAEETDAEEPDAEEPDAEEPDAEEPEPAGINFTPEEQSFFDRIVEMGFPAAKVLDAFIANGKNENATINALCTEEKDSSDHE